MPTKSNITIGVLVALPPQLLDFSSIDLFFMLSEEYLKACGIPAPITDLAPVVNIHYIGADETPSIVECTARVRLQTTDSINDATVAAGKLDVLLIPGPDPSLVPGQEVSDFIKAHAEAGATLLVVCTGAFTAGYSGVLKGKKASGPRALVPRLAKLFPDTTWDSSRRFVKDGNVWSSGGITNGLDMAAAYIKTLYPGSLSNVVCAMADVGDRGETYASSSATDTVWFVWQILKAAVARPFKSAK